MNKLMMLLLVVSTTFPAMASDLEINFGLVLKNEYGEPVGFKETTDIPLVQSSAPTLYGFVVTKKDTTPFTLGAVHILPITDEGKSNKVMGKSMKIIKRGAIFMQTDSEDKSGDYKVEIYIDNILFETIDYRFVPDGQALIVKQS